jgi:hypothetical protein
MKDQDFVLINISLKRKPKGDSLWPDTARIASIYRKEVEMVRNLLGLSHEEYEAYVDAMSDIWAEDLKLYGPHKETDSIELANSVH